MGIEIKRMTNANVYCEGNSLLGKAEEVTLPAIKATTADVNALGLVMKSEVTTGFEKMSGKIKWNALYPDVIKTFGNPFQTRQIQVRSSQEHHDSSGIASRVAVVAYLTVRFKDALPAITFKQGDNPEQESEFSCTAYKLEIDGERIIEFDSLANIFFLGDEDQLATYRSNLGF